MKFTTKESIFEVSFWSKQALENDWWAFVLPTIAVSNDGVFEIGCYFAFWSAGIRITKKPKSL